MREKSKGIRERGQRYLSQGQAKNCIWIERQRQTWYIGKWRFIKIQGETSC